MCNGLAGYQDETILVNTETMKKMCKSFDMKPVYVDHQPVDLENLEQEMAGLVTRCFYNEMDGWLWAEIAVTSDEGKEAVKKGMQVSNAYIPTEWGGSGTCHDIAYDREILNGDFTHLAIVPNPRYEEAVIMTPDEFKSYQDAKKNELEELKNSKTKKRNSKMIFWTKKEVENSDDILEASVTLINGKDVTIREMIETIENAKKDNEKKEKINDDMEVSVDGKKMRLGELVSAYQEMNKKNESDEKDDKENESTEKDEEDKENKCDVGKTNADEDDKEKKEKSEDKENKNSKDDEDEKIKEDEKANSKFFDELSNASAFGKVDKSEPALRADALKRGKDRY